MEIKNLEQSIKDKERHLKELNNSYNSMINNNEQSVWVECNSFMGHSSQLSKSELEDLMIETAKKIQDMNLLYKTLKELPTNL